MVFALETSPRSSNNASVPFSGHVDPPSGLARAQRHARGDPGGAQHAVPHDARDRRALLR